MWVDAFLPSLDLGGWVLVALALLAFLFLAFGVRDRRRVRRRPSQQAQAEPAAPLPVPEEAVTKPHRRAASETEAPPPWLSFHLKANNLRGVGEIDGGPIASRLWWAVGELAQVMPQHTFTVEVMPGLRGFAVAEPSFTLAVAALVLHAAQVGRRHIVDVALLAPEHPHYRHGTSPQIIVHVTTEPERIAMRPHLADSALICCREAGGQGSIRDDGSLWLIWPTKPNPHCPALLVLPSTGQLTALTAT